MAEQDKRIDELENSVKELRKMLVAAQQNIRDLERFNSMLTSGIVSAVVTTIFFLLINR